MPLTLTSGGRGKRIAVSSRTAKEVILKRRLKRQPFMKEIVYGLIKLLTASPLEEMSHGELFNKELFTWIPSNAATIICSGNLVKMKHPLKSYTNINTLGKQLGNNLSKKYIS